MSAIETLFYETPHRICQKWAHYLPIYEKHFARFRDRPVRFLEIGLSQGGSLDLWTSYFGPSLDLVGMDVDPLCKRFENKQRRIFVGDQGDRGFLQSVVDEIGTVDIVLDDGGHTMEQQIASFEILFPAVRDGGVYMCEDVHTSYSDEFGGGLKRDGSFIEFMKDKVDELHNWYIPGVQPTQVTRQVTSISFYDSIVVLEKLARQPPMYVEVGR